MSARGGTMSLETNTMPTLRIVLTNKCNGKCFFCHREGYASGISNGCSMSYETIEDEIIPAIKELGVQKVIFTGGEPTLYGRLADAIRVLKETCDWVSVELTTNGYKIEKGIEVEKYIDKITVSISSLKSEMYANYTGVNPFDLVKKMDVLKHARKAVSIVITNENCSDINEIINFFLKNNYEVKLQFVIGDNKFISDWEKRALHKLFNDFGPFSVKLGSTPALIREIEGNTIRIKLASLNSWMYDNIYVKKQCISCPRKMECVERGCAVRVYPNGSVTPCLNGYKVINSGTVRENIIEAYRMIKCEE